MSENNTGKNPEDRFTPMEGLENVSFTLPEPGDPIGSQDTLYDDWIAHRNDVSDTANITVDMHRRDSHGLIAEVREGLPAAAVMEYHELQKPLVVDRAIRNGGYNRASETRRSIVEMVRGSDKYKTIRMLGDIALLDREDEKRQSK